MAPALLRISNFILEEEEKRENSLNWAKSSKSELAKIKWIKNIEMDLDSINIFVI